MAYVAAKGGEQAILHAEELHRLLGGPLTAGAVRAVEEQLPLLIDRVMGEASLYAPELAALALAQTGGDLYEAVLTLRAYRSTQPRLAYAEPVDDGNTLTLRRISAAFKDVPGGQVLGPSLDYSHRLLRLDVLDGTAAPEPPAEVHSEPAAATYPAVADWQRSQELLPPLGRAAPPAGPDVPDLTREPLRTPADRCHRLQALARADTGGVLALGYAHMRQYGAAHPTVNEVRLGLADVQVRHPITGEMFSLGRVRVSSAEVVDAGEGEGGLSLDLGFTATLGWNEVKTIAGAMLDHAMSAPEPHPAHTEDFVLRHTDPVEASGFCIHYKLPHYVTFASKLDVVRGAQQAGGASPSGSTSRQQPRLSTPAGTPAATASSSTPGQSE